MRNKLSRAAHARLTQQLRDLQNEMITVALPEIERAREFSNSEENDDLIHARAEQRKYENRIAELQSLIDESDVIDAIEFTGQVVYGTDVSLVNTDDGTRRKVRIVGELEGTNRDEISFKSPFGQALLGHSAGDDVEIRAPGGIQNWEILDVSVSNVFAKLQERESSGQV